MAITTFVLLSRFLRPIIFQGVLFGLCAGGVEKTIDFGEVLGGTYAVDATNAIQALGDDGWWGPLSVKAEVLLRGRDGNGNECGTQ